MGKNKKQNAAEIQRETRKFLLFFLVLSLVSFNALYFFYKSYSVQYAIIQKDVVSYKAVLNKQQVLYDKLDTIYYRMNLLNTDKVENNVFLGNYISKNIQEFRKTIGKDSVAEFSHYAFLLTKLDSLLTLKNEIVEIEDRKSTRLNSSHHRISYAVFCLKLTRRVFRQIFFNFFNLINALIQIS